MFQQRQSSLLHSPVTDVYSFRLPAEMDLIGPKRGLFQFRAPSANRQLRPFTTHAFHFHSLSLWQIKLQQHVLMSGLIVQTFDVHYRERTVSFIISAVQLYWMCTLSFLSSSSWSWELYSFAAVPELQWQSQTHPIYCSVQFQASNPTG